MPRALTSALAFLAALVAPVAAFDLKSSTAPGNVPSALAPAEIAINRADKTLLFRNVDGTIGRGALLNATAAGRSAVEQGKADDLSVGGQALSATLRGTPGATIGSFGRMSDDGSGNFVSAGGGLWIGGPQGIWLRQEGFYADKEEGSLAMYPLTPNRAALLSIAPSGDPDNIPTETISGLALQMANGSSEERLTISAKHFGPGVGEYRIAPYKNGSGSLYPVTIGNGEAILQEYNVNKSIRFTNRAYRSSASAGNTAIWVENPAHTNRVVHYARQDGSIGQEIWFSGASAYEWSWRPQGPTLSGTQPALTFVETDVPANARRWFIDASGGELRGFVTNDDVSAFSQFLGINRNGAAWAEIALGGAAGAAGTFALVRDASTGTLNVVARALRTFANDAAAAAATPPVPLKGLYNDASGVVRVRLN